MRRRLGMLIGTGAAWALLTTGAAAAVDMQDGLWEITVRMEMPGMPAAGGTNTVQQCYTKQDVQNMEQMMPAPENCSLSDLRTAGNTVTWTMRCTGEGAMTGRGTMTFSGASYAGTINVQTTQAGHVMAMTQHIAGRRVGPCP